jgi:hypothetical protein
MATENVNCPHCKQALDTFVQPLHPKSTRQPSTYGTCRTVGCPRINITRELGELLAFTDAQVAEFHTAKAS